MEYIFSSDGLTYYGDDGRILVDILVKSISIANKYSLYNTDGDWQSVAQGVGRALTGKGEK